MHTCSFRFLEEHRCSRCGTVSLGVIQRSQLTFPLKLFRVSERVSGAIKAGVPAVPDSKASLPSNWLLTPKSAIFTWPSSPSSRFEGLISR